jgi:phosphomethylpyrimidine synthase
MKQVAADEGIDPDTLVQDVAKGHVVILKNLGHDIEALGVGKGLRTKVNANIGTSPDRMDVDDELIKLEVSEKYGADTIMDLSLGTVLNKVRRLILEKSSIPVGTVPMYQMGFNLSKDKRNIEEMTIEDYLQVVEEQGKEGVDFITVHAGLTWKAWEYIKTGDRIMDVVSRGGSMLAIWMEKNQQENPLYTHFDKILELAYKYDMTLSLGDGMRPGATADAGDRAQVEELVVLGELARRAREANVQVMIEGPGHVPLDEVVTQVKMMKSLCDDTPFYILGPLVTDIAPGYDHIVGAIGGALAASAGADFLCYLTPAEHLRLPDPDDVKEGVIASRIAAHAADMVKYGAKFKKMDDDMSRARKKLDWDTMYKLAIDPELARTKRAESGIQDKDYCSMCGEFCSVKNLNEIEALK